MTEHEQAAQILHDVYGDAVDDVALSTLADEIGEDLEARFREVAAR